MEVVSPVGSVVLIDYDKSNNPTGNYTLVQVTTTGVVQWSSTANSSGAVASLTIPDTVTNGTRTMISILGALALA